MPRANTLARRAVSSTESGTGARILEGALELLNRKGGSAVTTNHIAAHLGMSPGNLYYHFRNREQIVRAIFPHVMNGGLAATAPPEGPTLTAAELGERHLQGVRILWRYRFFFRDLNQLLARDPGLAGDFRGYLRRLRAQYRALFEQLMAQGDMRAPRPGGDLDRIVTDSIVVWINWIPYLAASRSQPEITSRDVIEGALHSFLVVAPFLEPRFAADARAVIEGRGRHMR
jgi:AcrR family transcriptional regulator